MAETSRTLSKKQKEMLKCGDIMETLIEKLFLVCDHCGREKSTKEGVVCETCNDFICADCIAGKTDSKPRCHNDDYWLVSLKIILLVAFLDIFLFGIVNLILAIHNAK